MNRAGRCILEEFPPYTIWAPLVADCQSSAVLPPSGACCLPLLGVDSIILDGQAARRSTLPFIGRNNAPFAHTSRWNVLEQQEISGKGFRVPKWVTSRIEWRHVMWSALRAEPAWQRSQWLLDQTITWNRILVDFFLSEAERFANVVFVVDMSVKFSSKGWLRGWQRAFSRCVS